MLQTHIRINRRSNIIPVNLALGNYIGKVKLYLKGPLTHSVIKDPTNSRYVTTNLVTFDYLMKHLGISHVNLVKIDVEGAELDVLKGIKKVAVDRFAIAAYHSENETDEVASFLLHNGYKVEKINGYCYGQLISKREPDIR